MQHPRTTEPSIRQAPFSEDALLDRPMLERLERLTLQWGQGLPGIVGGQNLSRFAGAGQEFLDHRSFHEGDDVRAVNWRAYLRFDRLFLKIFQLEPRVPVRVLLDSSASMGVREPGPWAASRPSADRPSKLEWARKLAAAFTYVGLVRLESILLQPFSGRLHDAHLASGGRHRFQPAELFLRGLQPEGSSDFLTVSRQFLDRYRQPGLTVVISDFFGTGDEQDILRPFDYIADFGHELWLLQVWDETDRVPADEGIVELTEAETGERLELDCNDDTRRAYTEAFDRYAQRIQRTAESKGGRYAGLQTSTPLETLLFGKAVLPGGLVPRG